MIFLCTFDVIRISTCLCRIRNDLYVDMFSDIYAYILCALFNGVTNVGTINQGFYRRSIRGVRPYFQGSCCVNKNAYLFVLAFDHWGE